MASRLVRAWVDQDNRRYYDHAAIRDLRTASYMLSYDAPQLDYAVGNVTDKRAGGRRFPGASLLNAPSATPVCLVEIE